MLYNGICVSKVRNKTPLDKALGDSSGEFVLLFSYPFISSDPAYLRHSTQLIRVLATAYAATARIQDRDVICGGRDIHRAGALGITLSRAAFWVLHFPTSGVIGNRENRTPVTGYVYIIVCPLCYHCTILPNSCVGFEPSGLCQCLH